MISPNMPDEDLRALFTRKPRCKDCEGTGEIRNFDNGTIKPCLTCGGAPDLGDTQEIDVDAVLARSAPCVDPQVDLDDTARWLAAQQPAPELPEQMQMVSGFLTGLVWAIEDRTPLDKLSDDQREILARVSQMIEQDLGTKNAD